MNDFKVIKLDNNFSVLWSNSYGSSGDETLYGACQNGQNGLVLCGQTTGFNVQGTEMIAIEIDENGSWKPLDLNKTYGMVSNNFIRGGGDGYKVFRSASEIYDFGPDLADVVADYIKANPGYSGYTDKRITQE